MESNRDGDYVRLEDGEDVDSGTRSVAPPEVPTSSETWRCWGVKEIGLCILAGVAAVIIINWLGPPFMNKVVSHWSDNNIPRPWTDLSSSRKTQPLIPGSKFFDWCKRWAYTGTEHFRNKSETIERIANLSWRQHGSSRRFSWKSTSFILSAKTWVVFTGTNGGCDSYCHHLVRYAVTNMDCLYLLNIFAPTFFMDRGTWWILLALLIDLDAKSWS